MFAPTKHWLSAFLSSTRNVMRQCKRPLNSCIEAACIGVGVARAFGYVATPVPVAVRVQGAGKAALVLPGPPGHRRTDFRGFEGHLLLHFAGDTLTDLTADQFHRPTLGLYVPGGITVPGVTREHLAGGIEFDLPTGTSVAYWEMPGNVEWRSLPAWTESSDLPIRLTVAELRRRLDTRRDKIGGSAARRS